METSAPKTGLSASKAEWDKLVADAKREGRVAIFAGPIGDGRSALTNAFQQKYGISLDIVLGRGEELLAKMESERRAGIYGVDAIIHGMTTYFNSGLLKSSTVPIAPLLVLPENQDLSKWRGGKYAAALAPDKSTTAALIRAGAPLAYADLKEPRPTSSGPGNIVVMDRAPHPNATKLFINWLLSKEGIAVYSKAHGYASTRLDVHTEGVDPIFMPKPGETILGEEYQLSKGEMRKLAAEIFRDLIK